MTVYRPGEVNCGHCKEPQGTTPEDYNGRVRQEGALTLTVDPCMRCAVHTYGMLGRCDDDCPDCDENDEDEEGEAGAGVARVSVRISNAYDDGTEVMTTGTATVPLPPEDEDERADWWYEHLFPLTGTGHEAGNAIYEVWIIHSDVPALVGLNYEFG